ncbi:hypothetical protein F4677DRAFT_440421 [Hypoxylon crocopeplum]|nr:hypothetical protein F4677DRAFT_440421 [Hypoxylon crocopeplum]
MARHLDKAGVALVVSMTIFNFFAVIAVALRFYVLRFRGRQMKTHDYLCVISLVTLFAYSTVMLIGTVDGGLGLHIWEVTAVQLDLSLKTFFASQFFWAVSIASFRLSILLLYLDLFAVSKKFQWAAWAGIGIVCSFFIGSIATSLSLCQPVAFDWDKTISGYCGDEAKAELVAAAFNMALDVVIVMLPLPVIWHLQLPTRKKVGISVTFGPGLG